MLKRHIFKNPLAKVVTLTVATFASGFRSTSRRAECAGQNDRRCRNYACGHGGAV
jgi:hypothetical protein